MKPTLCHLNHILSVCGLLVLFSASGCVQDSGPLFDLTPETLAQFIQDFARQILAAALL